MQSKSIKKSLHKTSLKINTLLKNIWSVHSSRYSQLLALNPFQEEIDENSLNEALESQLKGKLEQGSESDRK
uniref:Uncharacterized protein n=1 Tax=Lepeophtheirus salmonis TaxID=72036 RepID=A0A0K2TF78_LEPSM